MQQNREIGVSDELDQAVSVIEKEQKARLVTNSQKHAQEDLENAVKSEKHAMLVMNELCNQMVPFEPGKDFSKEIDLMTVAESLN